MPNVVQNSAGIQIPEKLKSRKFWMGLGGALAPIVTQVTTGQVGWGQALALSAGVIVTYLIGQSAEDVAKHKRAKLMLPHEDA